MRRAPRCRRPGRNDGQALSDLYDPAEAVSRYVRSARRDIDAAFGEGHAARHPELVAAFVQACAIEAAVAAGRVASRETNATILKLKPRLFG